MRFSIFSMATMAFATLSSAYTQPVGNTPSGNPTKTPALGQQVPAGKSFAVTWTPTTSGTVTIVLLRGPSTNVVPLYAIAEKIPNHGTFDWTPATDLPNDSTHYGLQIIDDANGAFQYTPQFGISNPHPTTSTVASAVSQISDGQVQAPATASSSSHTTSPTGSSLKTVTTKVVTTLTSVHTVASTVANTTTSAHLTSATTQSSAPIGLIANATVSPTLTPATAASATASTTTGVPSGAAVRLMAGNAVAAVLGCGAVAFALL